MKTTILNKQKQFKNFIKFFATTFFIVVFTATTYSQFNVVQTPPTLINPTEVVLSANSPTGNIVQYGQCGFGKVYFLDFADNEDALVTFEGNEPLPYPVHIKGGRNVIIRGLEIVIVTQPGNEIGTVILSDQTLNETNPHPVIPACGGLRLNVKSTATHWVEGLHLDMMGHDADAIIINSDDSPISSRVVIQNSLIEGVEGSRGLHGDVLQTQTGHLKDLFFENVTMKQSTEGVVLSFPVDNVKLRNVNYDTDTRFDSDDPWDDIVVGGFFIGDANRVGTYDIENIYIKYKNPETGLWFIIKDKHFSSPESAGIPVNFFGTITITETHPEVHYKQAPPSGDYALASQVGKHYNNSSLPDTTPPSTPANLDANGTTQNSTNLSWAASTDNESTPFYHIYKNNTYLETVPTGTTYTATDLTSGTTHTFKVRAKDAAGNLSGFSNTKSVTTTATGTPVTGLVGHWLFDGNANDISGNNHHGTPFNNPEYPTAHFSKGLKCNNAYTSVPSDSFDLNNFTLMAWIKPDNIVGTYRTIMEKDRLKSDWYGLYQLGKKVHLRWSISGHTTAFAVNLSTSTFTHIAGTFDGTTVRIYENGILKHTVSGTPAIPSTNNGELRFGITGDNTEAYLGIIDDAKIFGSALSQEDIQAAMLPSTPNSDTTLPSVPTNLVANGTTQTSTDLSWTASTDNQGVTGYNVYTGSDNTNIMSVSGTNASITGLSPNTTYAFKVRAKDAAGNLSGFSNTKSVTTPDQEGSLYRYLKVAFTDYKNFMATEIDWITSSGSVPAQVLTSNNSNGMVVTETGTGNPHRYRVYDDNYGFHNGIWIGTGTTTKSITLDLGSNTATPTAIKLHKWNKSWSLLNGFKAYGSTNGTNWDLLVSKTNVNGAFNASNSGADIAEATFSFGGTSNGANGTANSNILSEITVYPNPTSKTLNIDIPNALSGNLNVRLVSMTGKVIWAKEINTSANAKTFDISTLATGLYILELKNSTELRQVKVVKQ